MEVYQHKKEIIPTKAVVASNIQQGAYENIAPIPELALIIPPPNIGVIMNMYIIAEVI